jgi:flavin-binding protein dodecin
MSVAKTIEITSSSTESFDEAIKSGIARAAKTINNIRGAWVKDQKVEVENGNVTEYRVTMKLTFVLSDDSQE